MCPDASKNKHGQTVCGKIGKTVSPGVCAACGDGQRPPVISQSGAKDGRAPAASRCEQCEYFWKDDVGNQGCSHPDKRKCGCACPIKKF